MTPKRVQFRKGVKLPRNTIYCGRPGKWGNPFKIGQFKGYSRDDAVRDHAKWIARDPEIRSAENAFGPPPTHREIREQLGGKDLACWCGLKEKCHVDLLLRIANPPKEHRRGGRK